MSSRSLPKPALRKGEATRLEFLAAARTVFARQGYVNAEISEIAREAGKSNGTFYIYFSNKIDILNALLAAFDQDIFQIGIDISPEYYQTVGPEHWRVRLRGLWDIYSRHKEVFYALSQAAAVDTHFAEKHEMLRHRALDDFRRIIQGRQLLGFCPGLDPDFAASALENMVSGYFYEWLAAKGSSFASKEAENLAFDTLVKLFDSVLCTK